MKYILVTGAFGGMGKATIEKLKNEGYTVFALDKTIPSEFKAQENNNLVIEENTPNSTVGETIPTELQAKENNNSTTGKIIPIEVDLISPESIQLAFSKIKSITNELFAIIHFAGIYMLNSLVEMPETNFDKIFNINVRGVFLINKTFLPLLKKGSKIIITTSELAPLKPLPFTGIYAITKSMLDNYAYSLKMELQLLGISVSVLRAGAVKTNMLGVSTTELDSFCNSTTLYNCNAKKFKQIVNNVEAKNIPPEKLAKKVSKILNRKNPKFAYSINRNKLLLLLNILPTKTQFWIIKKVLK